LSKLEVKLDNETLIISPKDDPFASRVIAEEESVPQNPNKAQNSAISSEPFSFTDIPEAPKPRNQSGPIALKKKTMEGDVPELPLPDRGATMGIPLIFSCGLDNANLTLSPSSDARR
jgi:ubiquitin thioesterase OTU1